jgi:hypothetical protein
MVKINIKNDKVKLENNFIFKTTDGVLKEKDGTYSKLISFKINPECVANINDYIDEVKLNEMIGEKLKQDFIKFLNENKYNG